MDTLAPYFEDMIFEPNSTTGRFIAVKAKGLNSDEWEDTFLDRPDQLEYFMYNWFALSVEDLGGSLGRFSPWSINYLSLLSVWSGMMLSPMK